MAKKANFKPEQPLLTKTCIENSIILKVAAIQYKMQKIEIGNVIAHFERLLFNSFMISEFLCI